MVRCRGQRRRWVEGAYRGGENEAGGLYGAKGWV